MPIRNIWSEFRAFAFKGNMIELAVAVIIGTAFGAVINALVKHVIMPLLSYVLPAEQGYREYKIGKVEIGIFLGELVNFLIIALVVFIVIVKLLGWLMRKKDEAPPAPPPPTREEVLLAEIRDLLKRQQQIP